MSDNELSYHDFFGLPQEGSDAASNVEQAPPTSDGVGASATEAQPHGEISYEAFYKSSAPTKEHQSNLADVPAWKQNAASFATGVGKAVPFGQDIPAAIGTGLSYLGVGPKSVPTTGSIGDRFSAAKRAQERAYETMAKAAPLSQDLGIATGIAGTLNPLSRAAAAEDAIAQGATRMLPKAMTKVLPNAAPAAVRGATSVGSNAVLGGVYGLGEGESLNERLNNATTGALIGGGAGIAIPAATAGVKAAASKVVDAFPGLVSGSEKAASRKIANTLSKESERLTPEEVAAAQERGQPILPIDVGGTKLRTEIGEGLKKSSDEIKDSVQNTLAQRQAGQQSRFENHLKDLFKSDLDAAETVEQLRNRANQINAPLYREAYDAGSGGVWNEGLANLMNSPTLKRAVQPALEKSANQSVLEGKPLLDSPFHFNNAGEAVGLKEGQTPTLEFWDHVKRSLDDQVGSLKRSGNNDEALGVSKLRNALVSNLDTAIPEYAAARQGASKYFGADNAFDAGLNFMNAKKALQSSEAKSALGKMSDPERELFAHGVASDLLSRIRNRPAGSNVSNLFNSPEEREKLSLALGKDRASQLEAFTRIEDLMSKAHSHLVGSGVNPKAFSGSYGDTLKGMTKDFIPASLGYELMGHAVTGGVGGILAGRVLSHLSSVLGKKTSEAMARKLMSNDPAAMQEVLGVISQNPQAMNKLRQITQTATALSPELGSYQGQRQGRADGGKVGYPVKPLGRMEKAVARAQKALAQETKPLMQTPDAVVAHALEVSASK